MSGEFGIVICPNCGTPNVLKSMEPQIDPHDEGVASSSVINENIFDSGGVEGQQLTEEENPVTYPFAEENASSLIQDPSVDASLKDMTVGSEQGAEDVVTEESSHLGGLGGGGVQSVTESGLASPNQFADEIRQFANSNELVTTLFRYRIKIVEGPIKKKEFIQHLRSLGINDDKIQFWVDGSAEVRGLSARKTVLLLRFLRDEGIAYAVDPEPL
ncbi:MAG: hypothetical protein NZ480_03535 [Bdellovibrionaceae bacterium]|nr:hypothetical protein [Pseudobdellovibrionaceae bacterium]MDW8190321.1 hypothetical protein [Pseudobdellovibrionaceae bacterium]